MCTRPELANMVATSPHTVTMVAALALPPRAAVKGTEMPRMLVTTEPVDHVPAEVMLDEQIAPGNLASDHFAAQLVERIGWALVDAESAEHRLTEHRLIDH